jgi:peptide/nickel transport system ATP-binding protein
MSAGLVVARATPAELFRRPRHPSPWGLLGSSPRLDGERPRRLAAIPGAPPSPFDEICGCRFAARCAHASDRCGEPLALLGPEHAGHRDCCVVGDDVKRALASAPDQREEQHA